MPIDFRLLGGLLKAAADPEVSIASFAQGVRVGPGARTPRCPKLYTKKRKWRIPEQREQVDVDEVLATQGVWNKNFSTLSSFIAEVEEALRDQAGRGQVMILPEAEARNRFTNLVVASVGAQKKEKPGGVVSARLLFDGTNGNFANTSTHLRDQERTPVAPGLKRLMREKAKAGEVTFGLTADVKEAHRNVPIHLDDWHLLGCQLNKGGICKHCWHVRCVLGLLLLEPSLCRSLPTGMPPRGSCNSRTTTMSKLVVRISLGCPLSWNKTNGGTVTNWVGFELLLKEHALGLAERRAAWVVKWAVPLKRRWEGQCLRPVHWSSSVTSWLLSTLSPRRVTETQ